MSCNHATLSTYNDTSCGSIRPGRGHPTQSKSATPGYYTVPTYHASGYDALTHGDKKYDSDCKDSLGSGFFNITQAYGKNAQNCNQQYHQSPCNGGSHHKIYGCEQGLCVQGAGNLEKGCGPHGCGPLHPGS